MVRNLLFAFSGLALAIASAAGSYKVSLFHEAKVGGTQLKPGDYRIEVKDNKAIFSLGKHTTEAPVEVQSNPEKYSSTSVKFVDGAIQEIRVGGTNTKLVFAN